MQKRLMSLTLLLGLLMVFLPLRVRADADRPYGICSHLTGNEYTQRTAIAASLAEANIKLVRCDFAWWDVERSPGVWNYNKFDAAVSAANANGIQLLAVLGWPPAWGKPANAQANLLKWRTYVQNVVNRYKTSIKYWEIANEINFKENKPDLNERVTAADYVGQLRDAYTVIKAIDLSLQVLFSGLANNLNDPWSIDLPYLDRCYSAGCEGYFDAMNVHPYRWWTVSPPEQAITAGNRGTLFREIENLRTFLEARHGATTPIWVMEMGYPTTSADPHGTAEADQGRWLPRTFLCLLQLGVERVFWYEYLDDAKGSDIYEKKFGLRADLDSAKSAWNTFKTLVAMRPPGSGCLNPTHWKDAAETTFYAQWLRPDGNTGWGLWTTSANSAYTFTPGGTLVGCYDELGVNKTYTNNGDGTITVIIGPDITYVVATSPGPTSVTTIGAKVMGPVNMPTRMSVQTNRGR